MIQRNLLLLILFIATATGVSAGGSRELEPVGQPDAARRVLIAAEYTQFKEALVARIVEILDDGDTYVEVVDHSRNGLDGVDPRQWSAVLITNSGARAQVRPHVVRWLDSVAAYDGNVVLHTTQINDWTPQVKVDSVTSASSMPNLERIASTLVDRVRRFL